ncbi:response regulator transcription factor [Marinoscillum pacificum]|uniref:response regulator transcription factor n=1 Tax=Marinoscillum pacificum TaxID=392723 RepID=UPI002157048B|nr:response regulator transcription factor [Marinoscillum pacificum]
MARILVVEDEPNMQIGLKDNLEFEQFEVTVAKDGQEGLDIILRESFDLIILDVMMPKMSGFDVCKAARNKGISTPIIFLTAKGEEIDKVLGLELGADDYITKPFSIRELVARVKAILRRVDSMDKAIAAPQDAGPLTLGYLTVDFTHYTAIHEQDGEVKMSHKEFEVLNYLLQHKGEVVSRYQLLEDVWGYDSQPTTRTVDNFILKLRQKIEENPNNPKHILTVHGAGYKVVV